MWRASSFFSGSMNDSSMNDLNGDSTISGGGGTADLEGGFGSRLLSSSFSSLGFLFKNNINYFIK